MIWLYVMIGGALGTLLRDGINVSLGAWLKRRGNEFPLPTTIVNVLGCFFIGWVSSMGVPDEVRALVVTGVLGGLTTFSTLMWESIQLLNARRYGTLAISWALQFGIGLAAVLCGKWLNGSL